MLDFTRMYRYFRLFVVVALTSVLLSCGGGGGGGGGSGGAATGPAGEVEGEEVAAEEASGSTPVSAPAPTLSSNAEMVSFVFTQADNPVLIENLSGTPQTVNDVSTVNVYYVYGSQQPGDLTALKPTIEVSAGATVSPASGTVQDFTSPVEYTVTAQDGTTTKIYTVTVAQRDATQRSITYDLLGGSLNATTPAPDLYNIEDGADLPAGGDVTKPNYYFAGWMDQDNMGQIVSSWGPNQRQDDVRLKAHWVKAPYVENGKIYANGISVTVKNLSGKTMVSFKGENNDEINLCDINRASEYQDLSGYTLFLGKDGNVNASDIIVDNGRVTMTGGNLSAIYGYNGGGTNIPVNVRIEIKGGTVSNVVGFNRTDSIKPNAEVIISGSPTIGDKTSSGIWLKSFTSQIASIDDSISSSAEAITLIADHSNISENTIVATFTGGKADAGKFKLLRDDTRAQVNVNAYGSNIITIGSFGLPDLSTVTWIGDDEFTLGTGNVNTGGTIFSVFADGGYLTVPEINLPGANFNMGIPLDDNYLEDGYDSTLSTSKKYRYIQFTSEAESISAQNADTFLSKIHFHTIRGGSVRVRINLETVPITGAGYRLNQDVFYLDGSFYKKSARFDTGGKSWPEAYNEAKAQTFNGLQGYLMTITSDAENKFVYDQLFKGMGADDVGSWIGGTRITPRNGYDASTWGWNGTLDNKGKATWNSGEANDYWAWACGPEAGKKFYTKGKYAKDQNYRASGMYSSWSNPKDCALNGINYHYTDDVEPNNGGNPVTTNAEYYTQYTGRYVWNDAHEKGNGYSTTQKRWQIHYYIVEFTPYEAKNGQPAQRATKTALHAERVYSKN